MGRKMDDAVQFRQMCSSANNKKNETVQVNYILDGHNLDKISSSKYHYYFGSLGVLYIQNICQKANRTIGFLKRVQSHSVRMTTLSLNNVDNKTSF